MFEDWILKSPERVSVGEEGEGHSRGVEDGKGTRTISGKSDTRNLEAERIRGRAKSTAGCVKLKTVTEIDEAVHVIHF